MNAITVIGIFFVFKFNYRHSYVTAKYWLFILLALTFSTANFIAPNSTEYYLLCLLAVGVLIFRSSLVLTVILAFILFAILIPKFYPIESLVLEEVSKIRHIINSALGIVFTLGIVKYIRSIHSGYQRLLSEQKDKLQASNQNMLKLFAMLSHDIRGPLFSTKQAVELMLMKELSAEKHQAMLSSVKKQLHFLCNNVNGLLNWSKSNMDTIVAKPERVNLKECISALLDELAHQASSKDIMFQPHLEEHTEVYADCQHVNLILRNLLVNAVKFSHRSSVIDIATESVDGNVEISVVDYGTGIPDDKMKTLFQNIQEPSWGTSGEKGTGLGLTLVYELLQLNKGKIKVSSILGKQTAFTVILPNSEPLS